MIVFNTSAIQSPVEELEPQGVNRNLRQILVRWCLLVGPWQMEGSPVFFKESCSPQGSHTKMGGQDTREVNREVQRVSFILEW